MVWAVRVEIGGHQQPEIHVITCGDSDKPREVTVGRPPAKADTRPDIVVPEKSVSKIHAVLWLKSDDKDGCPSSCLVITDRSRFGTSVNGQKMALGGSQELKAGDVVQLAPKAVLVVEQVPVVLAVHPAHQQLARVRAVAAAAGAAVVHRCDESTTHVLYDPGDPVWSAIIQGTMRGIPFTGLGWLSGIASAGLMVGPLPRPPDVAELHLGPSLPPTRVPLKGPVGHQGLLAGFTFGYSSAWQDSGLEALLRELGGRVAHSPGDGPSGAADVILAEQSEGGGSCRDALSTEQLLMGILALGPDDVRQLVLRRSSRPGDGSAQQPAMSWDQADSDVTQAADEDDDGDDGAQGGGAVEQRPGVHVQRQAPAQAPEAMDTSAPHPADAAAAQGPEGWMVVTRRPEDLAPPTTVSAAMAPPEGQQPEQHAEANGVHEDAPAPKRRRLATAAATVAGTRNGTAAAVSQPPASNPFSRTAAAAAAAAATNPSPSPAPPSRCPAKHEPVDEAPWMTQHPSGRNARRGSVGLRAAAPPAAATVKAEPPLSLGPGPVPAAKGRGKKSAAKGGGDVDDQVLLLGGKVKAEEPPVPELLDASAQVVLETDLFAPTPEQQLPPRCRSGSAEPLVSGPSAGTAGAASSGGGGGAYSWGMVEAELPDFKQFRKQGAQLPVAAPKPLPVFLVDNFQRMDDMEAFLRAEEERINNKRQADEMFKNAEKASKKPTRTARR